ncbi:P-loop containing nucleoside triphosphate hydrolase protein [Punctularia strigosozonata HHB-11173 SS5]|uniref:P-loop containing nucleoside triphosphate hydrolase protein n=1 Tax=Punctularia strigosozonata (strain HHB-11173) TaxID=741275 RepID=UPI00044186C9|nr:P-loop containing nucleoside triphosphate hydrolase protein [Punctularia strigosozonata HHB-11173 SS5]EIN07088.1 P-loop containing nucleoside triphosphate hydrolase protein [Punctularia strigosozonata HHB-11173 SS5]
MNSDENIVISAPTGSGKTVLFELAMIRILMNDRAGRSKCVYMAPTKALCAERARDWATKFEGIGVKCCELTGDTAQFGSSAWGDARHASIIVTTGEKWDSLTRHWSESAYILDRIKLFMVHILNESRGGTLEVVVSRMKNRGTQVRFMMVSATVPNIVDIANWVGCATSDQPCHGPAEIFEFDESFRPCKITRVVKAFQRPQNMNDFAFAKILDAKLFNVLQEHSRKKPILIFVATRKGVLATAERLLADYSNALGKGLDVPWLKPKSCDRMFDDKRLERLALYGIGVHHAGISMSDRRATEELFLNKFLNVVVATSTLAVGVNLPAHTVVIRGVKVYHNNTCQEYSDLDVMQMIGRAGRPQFDNEGLAIIMCEQQLESKYQALAQGKTLLESCLHLNLCEHINSEIGLGTITDIRGARKWLKDSFLFQRIQRNPCYYHIGKNAEETWENKFDRLVDETVKRLGDHELLQTPGDADGDESRLRLTEYGEIMSKVSRSSIGLASFFPDLCSSAVYIKLRTDDGVRFKLSKIEKPGDKIFILMQAVLGGVYLNSPEYRTADSQPYLESTTIFRHAPRIAKGIVEVAVIKKSATQLLHGLELCLLNRRPPYGQEILESCKEIPTYRLEISEVEIRTKDGRGPVHVKLKVDCGRILHEGTGSNHSRLKKARHRSDKTCILTMTSDHQFLDFRTIPTKLLQGSKSFTVIASLIKPSQSVIISITSESVAGNGVTRTYKPEIDPKQYPILDTRPQTSAARTSLPFRASH